MRLKDGKRMFLIVYLVSMTAFYFSFASNVPFSNGLGKMKYLLIIFAIADCIYNREIVARKKEVFCFAVLAVYILLFGLVFENKIVEAEIHRHFTMMVICFLMLFFIYVEVVRFQCFKEFLIVTYASFSIFLLWCCFTHLNQIVLNPFYYLSILFRNTNRVRSDFGIIGTSNYCGHFCYAAIIVGIICIWHIWNNKNKNYIKKILVICICLAIEFMMLGSSSSRAAYTSVILFMSLFFLCFLGKYVRQGKKILVLVAVCMMILLMVFGGQVGDYIWTNSNRSLNITNNRQYFKLFGNIWTGMGFVGNSAFQSSYATGFKSAFGVQTTSIDMYYVYLYYTTGIIGCIMVGSILLVILNKLVRAARSKEGKLILFLYISMLYYAYWESILFNEQFWPALILTDILLVYSPRDSQRRQL